MQQFYNRSIHESLAGQIIVEVNMNSRYIMLFWRHFKLIIQRRLIYYAIFCESCLHVEDLPFSFPCVALCVDIYFLVPIQDLPNSLLPGHFQLVFSVAQSVDDADKLGLFCEFANEIFLIFPPRNRQRVVLDVKVKIFSLGNVKLLLPVFVDKATRTSCLVIEPARYVRTRSLNNGVDFGEVPIFLNEGGQVVDFSEEADPDIVGSAVTLKF